MERQSTTKDIAGTQYVLRQLGAKEGSRHLLRIQKTLLAALVSAKKGDVPSLIEALDEKMLFELIDVFAKATEVVIDSKTQLPLDKVFDFHFAGKYEVMMQWLQASVEYNYSGFFALLRDLLGENAPGLLKKAGNSLSTFSSETTTPKPSS